MPSAGRCWSDQCELHPCSLFFATVGGLIAACFPAPRVARLNVPEAISYG